jgi:ATP-binding cassette subfamily B protein
MLKTFPNYLQLDTKDCGPTCLKIIARYYKKKIDIQLLRELCETTRIGSTLLNVSEAAEKIGLRSLGVRLSIDSLDQIDLPCILHWNKSHYVVLYRVKKGVFYISDPAHGLISYSKEEFTKFWIGNNASDYTDEGIALLLEPTPYFYSNDLENDKKVEFGFSFIFKYLLQYKNYIIQLAIGLLSASILQLLFPFLTQSIVDVGIQNQNLSFIYLILLAQLFLFFGKTALELVRHWILLHLSVRINISLISDFFIKLMNLPISFFDVRMTGDILQRINDHKRIERILTNSSLDVLFSFVNMIIMGGVLAYYNLNVFLIYFIGSAFYFGWILLFLKKRETLDYKRFSEISQEQSKVIELINGMQEIKLHNAEKQKRWGWEYIQARLFKVSIKGLILEQVQGIGSNFINEIKNIFIIFLSAKLVIEGEITLGMMMAISLIVGSLNGPILQLINFVREFQDARISLSRLSEIHSKDDEILGDDESVKDIELKSDIILKNVSFRYTGSDMNVLKDLDLVIPTNKITAIVGGSGSGKTTLMKLLLKFYKPNEGTIEYGKVDLKRINQKTWRNHVGTVMQEGYIFNDTIANNIAVGEDIIDKNKLEYAVKIANIKSFIEELPLHYNTKIGMEGVGMSSGQKQRLLIARAIYKDPSILFFDEATSALDANNEKVIMSNLNKIFKDKTVIIIAHRLSTVVNADNIVVLDKGRIVEQGTHEYLVTIKGNYYELVKNQLQLGS